jgi:heme-degrading monooxygenase HmoA
MFSVIFEVRPKPDEWDTYLANANMLRPELEQVDGFIDNIRYKCLTREGWILSLSGWRDEKSLVRWRTHPRHHEVQEKARNQIRNHQPPRLRRVSGPQSLRRGDAFLRRVRCGPVARRSDPPLLLAGQRRGGSVRDRQSRTDPARRPSAPGPDHPGLRHVRPPRGAPILFRRRAVPAMITIVTPDRDRDGNPLPPDGRARLSARRPGGHRAAGAKRDRSDRSRGHRLP